MDTLYAIAQAKSKASTWIDPGDPYESACDIIHRQKYTAMKKAQESLRVDLLEILPKIVHDASANGQFSAPLFGYNHKYDTYLKFPYTLLFVGPMWDKDIKQAEKHGFVPLFDTLRDDVAPFQLKLAEFPYPNYQLYTLSVSWELDT